MASSVLHSVVDSNDFPSMVADNTKLFDMFVFGSGSSFPFKLLFPFELLGKASIVNGGFVGGTEVKVIDRSMAGCLLRTKRFELNQGSGDNCGWWW